MDAAHFMNDATFYEVKAFLDGAAKRIYDDYNRTRLLMYTVVKVLGGEAKDPTDLLKLVGDPQKEERKIDYTELENLKQMAKKIEEDGRYTN